MHVRFGKKHFIIYRESINGNLVKNRKIVFEDVRLKYFPEKPSRRNGLWLCGGINTEYWKGKLNNTGKILTLKSTGKIHKGCAKNLSSEGSVLSRLEYTNEAFKYWAGVINDNASIEYLFIGQVEVVAIDDIAYAPPIAIE